MCSDNASVKILAVDDNAEALFALESILEHNGYEVITACDGEEALAKTQASAPDIILSDVVMPKKDGFELARAIKSDPLLKYVPIILLTSKDSHEDIQHGLAQGADDYICKPYQKEELLARLNAVMRTRRLYKELQQSCLLNKELRNKIAARSHFSNIIGKSAPMQELYELIEKVSNADVSVLITGESGTGKELVASAIHYHSSRKEEAFVVQNCSAFNENLLESELFGHIKGSFTGAHKDKQGLFEVADKGSFFLDELAEMSMGLQAKLLRVLQDGSYTPVGATASKKVDVRIIAATNRDLLQMISDGSFREDLYYRLNVINLHMPPLRERKVDIPMLVEHFLEQHSTKHTKPRKEVTNEALVAMCAYNWPGNIRELQNEIERMIIMAGEDEALELGHLSPHVRKAAEDDGGLQAFGGTLKEATAKLEKQMISLALDRTAGNKSEVARQLGVSRSSLISKIKEYNL